MQTFDVVRGNRSIPLVLCCDHASGHIPEEFANLGLSDEEARACAGGRDLGAGWLFDRLREHLDCRAIRNGVSRLVIDTNRNLEQDELVVAEWNGLPVPANQRLRGAEVEARVERYWRPYHEALHALLEECERRHGTAFLFSIHTMAAQFEGRDRDMDFAVVAKGGLRWAPPLMSYLEALGYEVSINEPYSLERDIVRARRGDPIERFNRNALLVELNERHRGDRRAAEALGGAIERVVTGPGTAIPQATPR